MEVSRARRYAQPILRLDGRAVSPLAVELVSHCLNTLVLPSLPPQRPTSVNRLQRAVEGTLAGLIAATVADWGDGWLRRPLSNDSFTGGPVGRAPFSKMLRTLDMHGVIEIAAALKGGPEGRGYRRSDTRLRLTAAGRKLADDYGVTGDNVGMHFAVPLSQDPAVRAKREIID